MPGKYYYDDSNDEPAERIFAFMEREKPLLSQQRRYAYACVPSLPIYAPAESITFQRSCARGWISGLLDTHVPLTDLPSVMLEDGDRIAQYPVLVLADLELLSEEALKAIHAYVENGGGVYISGDPARLDEDIHETAGTLVRDTLDLEWQPLLGMEPEDQWRRCRFELGAPLNQTYDVYLKVDETYQGDFPVPRKRVFPTHFGQTSPGDSWTVVANLVPTDDDKPLFPALAVKRLGQGRMVFSSVAWGHQYAERREPALGAWMKEIISWLGDMPLPVQVSGSRLVHLGTTRVDEGWLLYVINNSNDIQSPRQYWREMMKVAERPLPVGSVKVSVPGTQRVDAIYGPEPDEVVTAADGVEIRYCNFLDHVVLHVY
jgi:hypothetical protein